MNWSRYNEVRNYIINCFGSIIFNAANSFLFSLSKYARSIFYITYDFWNVWNNYNLLSINNNQQQIGVTTMKVINMTSNKGNKIANQFIIEKNKPGMFKDSK